MTYACVEELPPQVRKSFSPDDAKLWMERYNFHISKFSEKDKTNDLPTNTDYAYYNAWMDMRYSASSRSFVAQVVVEDSDVYGETPIVEKYVRLGLTDIIRDGGIGIDKHSSKNVWCVWDIIDATDNSGRPAIIIQGNFFRDKPMFDISWKNFLKGRSQFSLGSYASSKRKCDSFKCTVEITPSHWFEISIVDVGASPNTGVIDVHVPEGEGEMNYKNSIVGSSFTYKDGEEFCSLRYAISGIKEEFEKAGIPYVVTWVEGVGAEVSINTEFIGSDVMNILSNWCDGVFYIAGPIHSLDMDVTKFVLVPLTYFTPLDEDTLIELIVDEEEAIKGYNLAIEEAKQLYGEKSEMAIEVLDHIRMEEEEHIRELVMLMADLSYEEEAEISEEEISEEELGEIKLKNKPGDMETVRNCPAGQHSHPGVKGCHDIMRVHSGMIHGVSEGKIDLTDENIDVNAIKNMPTARLKAIVLTIAKTLSRFNDVKVEEFMSSAGGKEFSLMFTELVNRKRESGGNMGSKEGKEKVALKESVDPILDTSALITILTDLTAKVEHLTSTVLNLKGIVMASEEQSGNIADAVSTAVNSIDNGAESVGDGVTSVGNAEGGDKTIEGEPKDEAEAKDSATEGEPEKETGEGIPAKDESEGSKEELKPEKEGKEKSDDEGEKPEEEEGKPEKEGEGEKEDAEETNKKDEGSDKVAEEEKEKKKVVEKSADPQVEATPKVKEKAGIVDKPIPSVPCDAPEVWEETPKIDVQKAVESEGGESKTVTKDGSPKDMVLPVEIPKGPIETKLEEVANTKPYKDDEATWETGLEDWIKQGRELLKSKVSVEVVSNPLETNVRYKMAGEDVLIVPPAQSTQGTGINLSETGRKERDFEALWSAIGSDEKTFLQIKKEVLR